MTLFQKLLVFSGLCLAATVGGCAMGDQGSPYGPKPADVVDAGADRDGDHHVDYKEGGDDCDDNDATVHPGAVENCTNGKDDDCNGKKDAEDPACKTECAYGVDTPVVCSECKAGPNWTNGTKTCLQNGTWSSCSGCVNNDADNDGYPSKESGGTDCNDHNAAIHPEATEICNQIDDNCDNQIDEGNACECSSGQNRACTCPSGQSGSTQTCQSNGTWGSCSACQTTAVCTAGTITSCNECPSGQANGTKTCSASGQWGVCTCTPVGPVACANLSNVTSWVDVTLIVTTTETSTVRFEGMCGAYDSVQGWTVSSDWTVIPTCEAITGSGTFTCHTKRPANYPTYEANAYLNNGYWSVGVKTLEEAQTVCPSSYNSTTKTCNDIWSVMSQHGEFTINGTPCKTSTNWVVNGNKDSFNCRVSG